MKTTKTNPRKNDYKGLSSSQVWEKWSPQQREHFLIDHSKQIGIKELYKEESGIEEMMLAAEYYAYKKYDELPSSIIVYLQNHIKMGQYEGGGKISSHRFFDKFFTSPNMMAGGIINEREMGTKIEDIANEKEDLMSNNKKMEDVIGELMRFKDEDKTKEVIARMNTDIIELNDLFEKQKRITENIENEIKAAYRY